MALTCAIFAPLLVLETRRVVLTVGPVAVASARSARPHDQKDGVCSYFRLIIFLSVFAWVAATAAHAEERLLPPLAGEVLQNALTSGRTFALAEGDIADNRATIRLCLRTSPQSCFTLRLDDPKSNCTGEIQGPWCGHWIDAAPPADLRDEVRALLTGTEDVWLEFSTVGLRDPDAPDPGNALQAPSFRPLALALALIALPLLAGGFLGRRLRHARGNWPMLAVPTLAVGVSIVAAARVQSVGTWDVVSVGTWCAAGIVIGASHIDARNWLLSIAAVMIALLTVEVGVRIWFWRTARFPPAHSARFFVSLSQSACQLLYDDASPDQILQHVRNFTDGAPKVSARPGPLVIHLGDSMVDGAGIRPRETFVGLLSGRQPDVVHTNHGTGGVATDFELLLLRRVLAAHQVSMVVLHVCLNNDIQDLDRPHECCDAGPLLEYVHQTPQARCPVPRLRLTSAARFGRSPPPYPLRVATAWSLTARHLASGFSRMVAQLDHPQPASAVDEEQKWRHFELILATMRDNLQRDHIAFVVALMPDRGALEAADPSAVPSFPTRRRVVEIATRLGINTLDAWDAFAAAATREGAARYFLGDNDIHLSSDGHRLYADWLGQRLPRTSRVGDPRTAN